jgi:outer membrane protein assembly factor BamB
MRVQALLASIFFVVISGSVDAQSPPPAPQPARTLSPQDQALNETLSNFAKSTPLLAVEKVVVTVARPLGMISAAAADKAGNIYILHRTEDGDPIVVVDRTGKVLRSWGKGMYRIPHSIHIDPQGNVWTTDANTSKVVKYTPEGKVLLEIEVGEIPDASRPFCSVTGIAFKTNGNVLISDGYCNARILEYSADGRRIGAWGKKGTGQGEFVLPHDVTISADGTVYVADRENGRVQWFDQNAKYLGEKTIGGRLYSVAVAPDGGVYLGAAGKGGPLDLDANIFKFNPATGAMEGRIPVMSHETEVGADGAIYPGSADFEKGSNPDAPQVIFYRPKT